MQIFAITSRFSRNIASCCVLLVAVACSAGTHSRGQFHGHVVGSTDEQITQKIGKPDEVDNKDPAKPRWIYMKKTFDPDNFNAVDAKAIIILEKNTAGKLVGKDVLFG
ncbi:MAG: hypothetical protein EXR28_15445 [Betaproteobacteria bacterium]|nr:hypothetical protein [Betaproteobacteria bacterium]